MNINEYQELAMRTNDGKCTERLNSLLYNEIETGERDLGAILNACHGLAGETGEVNDMIKKWIYHGHLLDEQALKKELGDVCWYLALMCNGFGFELEEIIQMNIEKLKKRYPDGFSEQASINRAE